MTVRDIKLRLRLSKNTHPTKKRAPGWYGTVWCPSTNSSLQISIYQIHQIFNISYFPQFNLSFEKKISFPQCPKIYTKLQNSGYGYKHRDLVLLETCVKTAFTCTSALRRCRIRETAYLNVYLFSEDNHCPK